MGRMRSLMIVGMGFLLGVTGQVALAQQPAPSAAQETKSEAVEELQLTRVAIQAARQAIVTQAMDLTPAEMETFWPLYREYRLEAVKIGDQIVALLQRYAEDYETMTDEVANKLLSAFVKIERARADLKSKYLPKFKKVLPATKVARFYQVENKLDVLILSEMAENIPLVR